MALAVWPSMVVFATLAASEHPFLPFYVTACSLPWVRNWKWVWSAECQRDSLPLFGPSAQMIPGSGWREEFLKNFLIASLFMAATIAPWTYRNWRVLHAWVPISTNRW